MSEDLLKDYFRILTQALRPGTTLPFNCYIHLKAQSRMIPYIGRDHEFTLAKSQKLSQFGYDNVYVKTTDKNRYFTYLDQFLQTEQGSTLLKELIETNGSIENIEGLPTQGEYRLQALMDDPTPFGHVSVEEETIAVTGGEITAETSEMIEGAVQIEETLTSVEGSFALEEESTAVTGAVPPEEETQKVTGSFGEEEESVQVDGGIEEDFGRIEVSGKEAESFGATSVVDEEEEESEEFKQILNKASQDIQEKIKVRGELTEEEKKILHDCTQTIDDELVYVKDRIKKGNRKDIAAIIENATLVFEQQIHLVARVGDKKNKKTKEILAGFSSYIETAQNHLKKVSELEPEEASLEVEEIGKNTQPRIEEIKVLISKDEKRFIKSTLKSFLSEAKEAFGKVQVDVEGDNELAQARLRIQKLEEELQQAKTKVAKQNVLIGSLAAEIKTSKNALADVYDSWEYYNAKTQVHADETAKLKAKELWLALDDVSRKTQDSFENVGEVQKLSDEILVDCQVEEQTKKQAQEQLEKEKGQKDQLYAEEREASSSEAEKRKWPHQRQEEISPEDEESQKSELEVLRCQLEDAQALLAENDKKISELNKVIEENEKYIKEVEDSVEKRDKDVVVLEDKVDTLEDKTGRYQDALRESDRVNFRNRAEIEARDFQIHDLKDKIEIMKKELQVYKSNNEKLSEEFEKLPDNFKNIVVEKDRLIEKLEVRLNEQNDLLRELKKEKANLEASIEVGAKQVKALSEKIESSRASYNEVRSSEQSLRTKLKIVTNSLEATRKAVAKLTEVSDSLREDRTKYMHKTNEALNSFKKAVNRATNLNKSLEVQKDRADGLVKENESLKEQNLKVAQQTAQLSNALRQAEIEKKKFESMIKELESANFKAEYNDLKKETDAKIKSLKDELRELKAELGREQGKSRQLTQQLKNHGKKSA